MVDDNFSCIKEVTKTVHIALPTACISNEISGICDVLETWKRQYIQQLQGIVVGYKNVSLSTIRGFVKSDCPVVHYDVKATFELFNPTAGSILKGKINRVNQDHIGCLVHNTINVTIARPNELLGDLSNFIILDRIILFQITRLDFKGKIIRVRGKITQECVDLMKESCHFDVQNDSLNFTPSDFSAGVGNSKRGRKNSDVSNDMKVEESTSDSSRSSPSKKKPKRSQSMSPEKNLSIYDIVQDSSLVFENSTDTSSHVTLSKKKKKHKKSKNDVLSSPPLFNKSFEKDRNEIQPTHPQKNEFSIRSFMNDFSDVNPLQTSVEIFPGLSDVVSSQINSPQKKKTEQIKTEEETIGNNTLENSLSDFETHDPITALLASSTKHKKSKKGKENSLKSPLSSNKGKEAKSKSAKSSKKKHKKSKSNTPHKKHVKNKTDNTLNIKEEIDTDSSSTLSPSKSTKMSESFKDVYEMMEALSSFEPPPEAQLLGNISPSKIKKEPAESPKKAKKRKRDSVDTGSLPKKKRKNNDGSSSTSKSKDKRKKKKDKSKKDPKKDKKTKPKKKVISSKKKGHGYKVKLKKRDKEKKNKDKNKKDIKS